MFLSIIIPVYNGEKYIAECIESCIRQNIPSYEYEIICIDDGSVDRTRELLEQFSKKYSNVYIFSKKNGGGSSARNIGIKKSKGKYIWFVDADDFIQENCLLSIKMIIDQSSCDHLMLKAYRFREKLTKQEIQLKNKNRLPPELRYLTEFVTMRIIKAEIIHRNQIFFAEEVHYGEDQLFIYEIWKYIKCSEEYDGLAYYHRIHNESAMHMNSEKEQKRINSLFAILDIIYPELFEDSRETAVLFFSGKLDTLLQAISEQSSKNVRKYLRVLQAKKYLPFNDTVNDKKILITKYSFYKYRVTYLWKQKIIERIMHPQRTMMNIKRRLQK